MCSNLGSPSGFSCQKDNCSGQSVLIRFIGVRSDIPGAEAKKSNLCVATFFHGVDLTENDTCAAQWVEGEVAHKPRF